MNVSVGVWWGRRRRRMDDWVNEWVAERLLLTLLVARSLQLETPLPRNLYDSHYQLTISKQFNSYTYIVVLHAENWGQNKPHRSRQNDHTTKNKQIWTQEDFREEAFSNNYFPPPLFPVCGCATCFSSLHSFDLPTPSGAKIDQFTHTNRLLYFAVLCGTHKIGISLQQRRIHNLLCLIFLLWNYEIILDQSRKIKRRIWVSFRFLMTFLTAFIFHIPHLRLTYKL
jgi:hypothetical protein